MEEGRDPRGEGVMQNTLFIFARDLLKGYKIQTDWRESRRIRFLSCPRRGVAWEHWEQYMFILRCKSVARASNEI